MSIYKLFRRVLICQLFIICSIVQLSAQEKVLISTDRDVFIAGENMWFNVGAYKLGSNQKSLLSNVVYVELINNNRVPVLQIKARVHNSSVLSQIKLPDTLSTGNYSLRAYTRWMENKDLSLYARKEISIINPFITRALPHGDRYYKNDTLLTFPESGNLFSGIENKILLKVLNPYGKGLLIKGYVEDEEKSKVGIFNTNKKGCALLKFTPEKTKSYYYCIGDVRIPLPIIKDDVYLKLIKGNSSGVTFKVYNNHTKLAHLDIVTADGEFVKRYSIPDNGIINVDHFNEHVQYALLVDVNKTILAYRAFSNDRDKGKSPTIKITKQFYGKRDKVNLNISDIMSLRNVSVSVVKSCLINEKDDLCDSIFPDINDVLIAEKPPVFISETKIPVLLPEIEGELITGRIVNADTNEPIIDEKFMLGFVDDSPILKFSKTDSLGRFRYVVNHYGDVEMVIQPVSNDTTQLNYKLVLDDKFSPNYSDQINKSLILDSIRTKKINNAIVNMQVNTVYDSFKEKTIIADSTSSIGAFYGKPNIATIVDRFIELPTVEEVVREIVPFVTLSSDKEGYSFKVYEDKSLYPRHYPTLTMVDGIPIKNVKSIFKISPQELKKIEVVNLNFYFQDEELGYLLCFYSKDSNMADMEFDQRIFRQVHKGFINSYKFKNPDYYNLEMKKSRLADFRNVLYYNVFPNMNEKNSVDIEFFTSDDESDYTVVVKGINSLGEFVENRSKITVSE